MVSLVIQRKTMTHKSIHYGEDVQPHLFNLRRLKEFGKAPKTLTNFYESILSCCITTWYGNCTTLNNMALQRVVRSAQSITGDMLPALQDIYSTTCQGQEDHEGPPAPEPGPVHPATI
jgi:hypothetical protein